MKLKNYSLILLMGMSSSAFALNVYNKDGNTLDIYGRVEGKIASGQNSFAGSESRSDLGGRIGIYLTRDLDILPETKIVGRQEWQVRTEKMITIPVKAIWRPDIHMSACQIKHGVN